MHSISNSPDSPHVWACVGHLKKYMTVLAAFLLPLAAPSAHAQKPAAPQVVVAGSFTLTPSTPALAVAQGASALDTITINDLNGFTGSVNLAATGLPSGVFATFFTNPATSSSEVAFTALASATAGTYIIAITGTSATATPLTATIPISLTVAGPGSFTVASLLPSLTVARGNSSGDDAFIVTVMHEFASAVTLTGSIAPSSSGVTCSVAPTPSPWVGILSCTASSAAVPGSYELTVTATSGSLTASSAPIPLTVTALPAIGATVSVNTETLGPAISDDLLGMNLGAWWDVSTNKSTIVDAFKSAGIKAVRWPGGSWADVYHWAANSNCLTSTWGFPNANDTFNNLVNDVITPGKLNVALTANYGSNEACDGGGDPTEAAAWAAKALALKANVSHITVGNEEYGTWETDLHAAPHDPATYANAVATGYYPEIKAVDPKVKVGVVVEPNYWPWDPIVLASTKYDFVEYHYYPEIPGQENDNALIQLGPLTLTMYLDAIKAELAAAGKPNTPIYVGEIGGPYTEPGKQTWSITQGLYAGEVLGEMMKDGVSRLTWFNGFGTCNGQSGNVSNSVYGWQNFGAYNVFSDGPDDPTCPAGSIAPNSGPAGTLSPTARAFQLLSQVAVNGEHVLTSTVSGDTTDVRAYSATNRDGTALVLFNLNESSSEPVRIELSGQRFARSVTVTTYDKAIYDQTDATTPVWAAPTTTELGAQRLPLTLTLTPWSMNVVILH
ncbi:MAG: hypothetical protein ABSG00_09595 [Terracidiphilus sp.]